LAPAKSREQTAARQRQIQTGRANVKTDNLELGGYEGTTQQALTGQSGGLNSPLARLLREQAEGQDAYGRNRNSSFYYG